MAIQSSLSTAFHDVFLPAQGLVIADGFAIVTSSEAIENATVEVI